MPRIQIPQLDKPASRLDKVIGSDLDNSSVTRNYQLGDILALFNSLSGGGVYSYKFKLSLTAFNTYTGIMATSSGTTDPDAVTTFRFSTKDVSDVDLTSLVTNYNSNSDDVVMRLTSEDDSNLIAVYRITGVTANATYVDVSVLQHKNFNSLTFVQDKYYTLSFDYVNVLGGGGSGVTNTSELTNDGEDGINPFITLGDLVTDHTLLSNIGTNTHVQIDNHIANGSIHFTQASISITESQISDLQSYLLASDIDTFAELQAIVADATLVKTGDNVSVFTNDAGYLTSASLSGYLQTIDIDTFAELQAIVADATLVKAGDNISVFTNDAGYITATLTDNQVKDIVGTMTLSNTETLITVTYQGLDHTLDFVVDDDLSLYDNSTSGFLVPADIDTFAELDAYVLDKSLVNLEDGGIFLSDISVPDEAYGAGWNGSVEVPTKNAVYDEIETKSDVLAYNALGTGLHEGGILSINVSTTTYDISAGSGVIVDNLTDPDNPVVTHVDWTAFSNIAPTNILTQPVTYISIDINGNIVERTTISTATQRRTDIFLGVVVHSNNINVNAVNSTPIIGMDVGAQLNDLLRLIGFRNEEGNVISAASTDLTIAKSAGVVFQRGVNFHTLGSQPHQLVLGALIPVTFRYRNQDSSEDADTTNLDPTTYDLGGVTTTVPTPNNATIQRVYIFSSNLVRIQRGQEVFVNFSTALARAGTEAFITESNISENGLYLGSIVVKKSATDLSDDTQAVFITSTGETVSSAINTTLQSAYDVSTIPQILTDALGGALTLQRGSVADTDTVFSIRNGASTEVLSVDGEGNIISNDTLFSKHVEIGTDLVEFGTLQIYGHGTGVAQGGAISLHTSADYDTSQRSYTIEALEDDLSFGSFAEGEIARYDGGTTRWKFYQGLDVESAEYVSIGIDDTSRGSLVLLGDGTASNDGGIIQMSTAADFDTFIDFYGLSVYQNDLKFGHSLDDDLLVFDYDNAKWISTYDFDVTTKKVMFGANSYINDSLGIGTLQIVATGSAQLFGSGGSSVSINSNGFEMDEAGGGFGAVLRNTNLTAQRIFEFQDIAGAIALVGVGSVDERYLRADVADTKSAGNLTFNDNIAIVLGSGGDALLYQTGAENRLQLNANDFAIRDASTLRFTFGRTTGDFTATGKGSFTKTSALFTIPSLKLSNLADGSGTGTGLEFASVLSGVSKAAIYHVNSGIGSGRGYLSFAMDSVSDANDVGISDEVMRLNNSGNLSIGNTNDTYKLDVTGDIRATTNIIANGGFTGQYGLFQRTISTAFGATGTLLQDQQTYDQVRVYNDSVSASDSFASIWFKYAGSSGNATGRMVLTNSLAGDGEFRWMLRDSAHTLYTEQKMILTSDGLLGVNITGNPVYNLDVGGTGRFTDGVYSDWWSNATISAPDANTVFTLTGQPNYSIAVVSNTTGSTNWQSAFGQALVIKGATDGRDFAFWRSNSLDTTDMYVGGKATGNTWLWSKLISTDNASTELAQFLRSDVADTANGVITFTAGAKFNDNINLWFGNAQNVAIDYDSATADFILNLSSADDFVIQDGGIERFRFASATGNFTATGQGLFGANAGVLLYDDAGTSYLRAVNNHLQLRTERDADDIYFTTGTTPTTRMFIQGDTGNVGIGSTAPSDNLVVQDATNARLKILSYTAIAEAQLTFATINSDTAYEKSAIIVSGAGSWGRHNMHFCVNNAATTGNVTLADSRMMIDYATGNIGIGTTSPTEKLHVYNGSIYSTPIAYAGSQDGYALKMGAYNNTAFDMGIKVKSTTGGSPYMSIRGSGGEDTISIYSSRYIGFNYSDATATAPYQYSFNSLDSALGTMTFALTAMDGTYNPRALIKHITSASSNRVDFDSTYSTGSGYADWRVLNGDFTINTIDKYIGAQNSAYVFGGATTIGVRMGVQSANNAGELEFRRWTGTTTIHDSWVIGQQQSDGYWGLDFRFNQQGTNTKATTSRVFFSGTGEVGIGTTAPAYKLDVSGDIRSTSRFLSTQSTLNQWAFNILNGSNSSGLWVNGSNATDLYLRNTSGTVNAFLAGAGGSSLSYVNSLFNVGRSSALAIEGTATHFGGDTPQFEVQTGTSTGTYEDLMVLRHQGHDGTAVTRRLGFLMKLSSESSAGESDKMGGMILESANTFANSPDLHLLTADNKRMTIQYGGLVQIANDLEVNGGQIWTGTSQARVKLSVWNSTLYGIGMQSGYTFGGIATDYAMTFQMNNSAARGFWWGDDGHTNAQGAMALTTNGKLTLAHSMRIGYGESDVTTPGATHALDVSGSGHFYDNSTSTSPLLVIEQDGSGDAVAQFLEAGGNSWVIGQGGTDNSFRMKNGTDVDSSAEFVLGTNGDLSLASGAGMITAIDDTRKTITNDATTTHTVTSTDSSKVRAFTGSTAVTVTVDTGSLINVGETAEIDQMGTGLVTIAAGTATLRYNSNDTLVSDGQYSRIAIQKMSSTEYRVFGQLAPA